MAEMAENRRGGIAMAILAAALYAVNAPCSKLLLEHVGPVMMAAWLYLGAGAGLLLVRLIRRAAGVRETELPLDRATCPIPWGWCCWTSRPPSASWRGSP